MEKTSMDVKKTDCVYALGWSMTLEELAQKRLEEQAQRHERQITLEHMHKHALEGFSEKQLEETWVEFWAEFFKRQAETTEK